MALKVRWCFVLGLLLHQTYCYSFGFNNSYTCHCLNNIQCDEQTGTCNNGCSIRWVGTSCQQENIAYNKSANQSGQELDQGPWKAVDGDRRNGEYKYCIDTNYSPWAWWLVDLGQLFNLRYFKIYYRFGRLSFLKGFSVHIDNELCYQHPGTSNPPAVFPIECKRTITGRYVNISNIRPGETRHFFSLCEVEIYVCSRGTYGSDCNNFCHCSNYDKCDDITGHCSNGCQIGWDGDSCSTKCKESYGQDCNKRCIDRKCSGNSTCNHVSGECINGCKPGYHGIDCTQECQGSYGQNCTKQCSDRKCLDQSSCNNIDGQCIGGCQAGYRSLDCTQHCHTGFYGLNCNSSCSERFCKINSTTCHHETGACSQDGCLDYYDGVDCTKYIGCPEGIYGYPKCQNQCSQRYCKVNSTVCDQKSGDCGDEGCLKYYEGNDCLNYTGCADGYYGYGVGCNKLCSSRNCKSVNSTCDQENGTCSQTGCLNGFQGHDCTMKISASPPESNKTTIAVAVCVTILFVITVAVVIVIWRRRQLPPNVKDEEMLNVVKRPFKPGGNIYENSEAIRTCNETTDNDATNNETSVRVPNVHSSSTLDAGDDTEDDQSADELDDDDDDEDCTDYINDEKEFKSRLTFPELEEYVEKTKKNHGFKGLYSKLPNEWTSTYEVSQIPENRKKSRFKGYYPYDHTRVIMAKIPGDPHSDFINANYINGYSKKKAYIAAQGATGVTKNDFVRMIWDQKCDKVIMLTNLFEMGKHKCEKYWPEDKSEMFGDLYLTVVEESVRANYTIRTICISKDTSKHRFYQYHYTSWPDHDVPEVHDLLDFLYTVNKRPPHSDKPSIIHCSAGVGRTGTYIAVDICLQECKKTGKADVIKCIKNLRDQRKGMVQTFSQLQFVFEALIEGLKKGDTSMRVDAFEKKYPKHGTDMTMGNMSIKDHFENLQSIQTMEEKSTLYVNDKLTVHKFSSHSLGKGYFFDNLKTFDIESIWKVVTDRHCPVTIFIIDNTNTLSICPEVNTEEVFGDITVESKTDETITNELSVIKIEASTPQDTQTMTVLILDIGEHRDFTTISHYILQVIEQLDVYMKHHQPITMFSSDLQYGRLFCILRNIQLRIKLDNEVEVFNFVRKMHNQLGKTVHSLDEYNKIHKFALEYIKSSSTYANL